MAYSTSRWRLASLILCILTLCVCNTVGKEARAAVPVGQMTPQDVEDALQVSRVLVEVDYR